MSTGAAAMPRKVIDREATTGERPEKPPLILWIHYGFIVAALGWLTLCLTIGYHFGWWLAPLGVGLGMLLAGLGLMARDALASWWLAYLEGREKARESSTPDLRRP